MAKQTNVANDVTIEPGHVPLSMWRRILRDAPTVRLTEGARAVVDACHAAILDLIGTGRPISTLR